MDGVGLPLGKLAYIAGVPGADGGVPAGILKLEVLEP